MKKKLFAALTCGVMMTGLAACGSIEKTNVSNESKPKQEEKKDDAVTSSSNSTPNTKGNTELDKDKKEQKFEDFALEYQLAIVMRMFQDVTIKYDYAIGNPEYLLQDTMDQKTIDDMKNMLQEQAKNNDKLFKDEVNQAYTYLNQSKVSNKDEIQKLINAENEYLKIVDKMIACIDSVTVENAKEKRSEMQALQPDYLKAAAQVTTTTIEVAKNSGIDEESFRSILMKFLKQPKDL
ncbi:hypothetical protein CN568_17765 [Bacillus pseudomycoides]|uniref:hypothetical protein n=1 Tax=Bacillus pseudomycoides TaxID=64104 RepID=UPI0001A15E0E|nr:hypothetical protein [Bacillus pseudomycoides]EEM03984.1 hypothetical protein bmyco0002_36140 [Bacillus pseudomycoides]PEK21714.1 hypothetical protein CN691_27655 [Bacillus pseudomycoides]PEK71375.1 hypothetical protein CN593_02590 [Bacillus pseudomycoides]PEP41797.1 hypothetical protein CN565_11205 [Bacillus pseudomycoides]PEP43722.1 hypothetical protein CN568_17765 [Bacillus pseudomycoides]